jgi:hypothetical protein
MNATSNTTSDMDTNNNPWVESGAMVYVAITVATMSAVIMCCTWFITHNTALQRWWHGKAQYGGLDEEEEEIELIEEKNGIEPNDSGTSYTDEVTEEVLESSKGASVFTLEDGGSSDSSGSDHLSEHVDAV